jgi:NAD+ diphosphatase
LAGFFAELDGADTIRLDEDELAVGVWLSRKDIPEWHESISLTGEMIEVFRRATVEL